MQKNTTFSSLSRHFLHLRRRDIFHHAKPTKNCSKKTNCSWSFLPKSLHCSYEWADNLRRGDISHPLKPLFILCRIEKKNSPCYLEYPKPLLHTRADRVFFSIIGTFFAPPLQYAENPPPFLCRSFSLPQPSQTFSPQKKRTLSSSL